MENSNKKGHKSANKIEKGLNNQEDSESVNSKDRDRTLSQFMQDSVDTDVGGYLLGFQMENKQWNTQSINSSLTRLGPKLSAVNVKMSA